MTGSESLRHVVAFVKDSMQDGETINVLRRGLEAALAALMEAEVSEQIGAERGEQSADRTTHRNGYRERQFHTGLGTSELKIPKLRSGTYFPSFLRAYKRSDDALLAALAQCFIGGVSTRNVEQIARALGVDSMSKSQVSEICTRLDPLVKAFRERELGEFPYVWLDARYENVREDGQVRKVAVLVALGARRDGMREVLGVHVERTENEAYWDSFLESLKQRGLHGVKLVVSDAHGGLKGAIAKRLPEARWQRCRVHFMRNVAQRLPKRKAPALLALIKAVFMADSYEDAVAQRREVAAVLSRSGLSDVAEYLETAEETLTYMHFPQEHWPKLHSTNVVERLNRELKRRTRVVSIFPNRASLIRLAGALLLEEHEEWLVGRRYIAETSMAKLYTPLEQLGLEDHSGRELAA
jgi:putative transposase